MHANRLTPMVTGVLVFASALALAAEDHRSATAAAPVLFSRPPGGQGEAAAPAPRLAMGGPGMMGGPGRWGGHDRRNGYGPMGGYGPMSGQGPRGGYGQGGSGPRGGQGPRSGNGPMGARGTPGGRTSPQADNVARPNRSQ